MKGQTETSKKSILVVDDDPEVRKALSLQLTSSGRYKTLEAERASEAFHYLSNQKFDCILLDIRLAKSSGEKVIQSLRTDLSALNHDTGIVVISGAIDSELVNRIRNKIEAVLVKPYQQERLLECVETAISRRNIAKDAAR